MENRQIATERLVSVKHNSNSSRQPISYALDNWTPPPRPTRDPLVGQFCRLEPLEPQRHAADLYEANALDIEGNIWTYLPYGPFQTLENYLDWMDDYISGEDPLFYAIIDNTIEKAVGVASYLGITPARGSIEVGHINYSPLLQKTPAATEAMYLMMDRAFELGYRRYEWQCDSLNAKSHAASQRLRLSFEGVFRQARVYKGRNWDTAWYAAIDKEWPALKEAFLRWLDPANFDENYRQRIRLSELTGPILKQRG